MAALPNSARVSVTVESDRATGVTSVDSFSGVMAGARSFIKVNTTAAPAIDCRVGITSAMASKYNWGRSAKRTRRSYAVLAVSMLPTPVYAMSCLSGYCKPFRTTPSEGSAWSITCMSSSIDPPFRYTSAMSAAS
jgi:hypothetical protein